ncbi:MAG: CDP-alcohol phosphatidyltransferase family protein, partial [Candidatus Saganbacteria bacterium]|nr:CDP-alcohol phosphatidyltransferase family protein [Candidatus Saganbacteria bacterium]
MRDLIKLPDYVTLLSTGCGVFSVFASISHNFGAAAVLLLAAVIFDRLDGKLARLMGLHERRFGKELDSLSDAISFGIAPAVFGYTIGLTSWLGIAVLFLFVCCGILRLARFNLSEME